MIKIQENCAVTGLHCNDSFFAPSRSVVYGHDVTQSILLYPNFTETPSINGV